MKQSFGLLPHLLCLALMLTIVPVQRAEAETLATESAIRKLKFEHLTSQNGLNQNTVTTIFKDSAGMLWLGTQDGLQSYNGKDFKLFIHNSLAPNSLSESHITDITQDKDGYLWISTFTQGINRLDLQTGEILNFGRKQGLTEMRTTKLMTIGDSLWIGTRTGLFSLSLKTLQINSINLGNSFTPHITSLANINDTYLLVGTLEDGVFSVGSNTIARLNLPQGKPINQIRAMSLNTAMLVAGDALWKYNLDDHKGEKIWQRTSAFTGRNNITDFTLAEQNEIWLIGPEAGLIKLKFENNQWLASHFVNTPYIASSLSGNTQISLLYDTQGILWLGGSYSGLDRINLRRQYFTHYLDSGINSSKQSNMIRGIFRSRNGEIWFGTEGDGLKSIKPDKPQYISHNTLFKKALGKDTLPMPLIVRDIRQDSDDTLWFASNFGLGRLRSDGQFSLFNLTLPGEPQRPLRALDVDDQQRLWVSTTQALFVKLPGQEIFKQYQIANLPSVDFSIAQIFRIQHQDNWLWLATLDGLIKLDTNTAQGTLYRHEPNNPNSLNNNLIRDILVAKNGDLWLGTHGGINHLVQHEDGPIFEHITVNQGLPSDTVYALLEDENQHIWFSSNAGISHLIPETEKVITYNEAEGIQALEFNGGVKWQDINGDMWFGGINGANRFTPSKLPSRRPESKIALFSYKVAGNPYEVLDLSHPPEIEMNYDDQVISFDVGSLDFNYPGLNQFAFYLDGFDSQWAPAQSSSEITYTNLSPGRYTLRVRHKLLNNPLEDYVLNVQLKVNAPFYMTPQAYTAYLLVALFGLIWLLYAKHLKRVKQREFDSTIRLSEERLKLALWASGDGMWDWNIKENKVYRTNMTPPLTYAKTSQTLIDNIHPDDKDRVKLALNAHLTGERAFFEAEYRVENYPNQWIWLLDRGKVVEVDSHNKPVRMAGTHKDITARKIAENELRLSSQVLQSMNEAVVVGGLDYKIIAVNPAFSLITGFSEQMVKRKHFLYLTLGKQHRHLYQNIETQLLRHKHWSGELFIRTRSRKALLVWLEINQVIDNKGEASHFVAVFTDITDRKKAEEDLRILASYDTLTGLPNRTLFQDRLTHAIAQAHRSDQIVALLFLDLDRFKHINDSLGHHIGDLLLKAVANRLLNAVRDGDTVARLGGDEFTIILEGVAKTKAATVIAEKLIRAFQTPFILDDKSLTISPSIGISMYPNDADNADSLVKFADTAMYHAKSLGRNNFQFYTESLNEYAMRHVQLEAGLKLAIARNEFQLVYQPKFRVKDRKLVGVEALLRWNSVELGPISPVEFIPLAEETGIINQIGHWVINQACAQMAKWIALGFDDIHVAVNLSARQLKADIVSTLEVALAVSDIPARALELELTESMIMKDPEESVAILSKLKALGLTLAVDDFGTGYSSLSYLKRFPIDTLKIDREFVSDITNDPEDAAITSAIIALAHSLELKVVAEGVETQEQLDYLAAQNCDEIQGFLLSKPLSASDCQALLRQQVKATVTATTSD